MKNDQLYKTNYKLSTRILEVAALSETNKSIVHSVEM